VESGLVQEVFVEDGHMHYEHVHGHDHHCHMRCLGCRQVIEICDPAVIDAERRLGQAHNFQTIGHKLEIYGYCSSCRGQ
jgi:Fur family ferric uptake transcriptional regulator